MSQNTYACEDGRHGDNSRRHLVGMTFDQIHAAGYPVVTSNGACGGDLRTVQHEEQQACDCACHTA